MVLIRFTTCYELNRINTTRYDLHFPNISFLHFCEHFQMLIRFWIWNPLFYIEMRPNIHGKQQIVFALLMWDIREVGHLKTLESGCTDILEILELEL